MHAPHRLWIIILYVTEKDIYFFKCWTTTIIITAADWKLWIKNWWNYSIIFLCFFIGRRKWNSLSSYNHLYCILETTNGIVWNEISKVFPIISACCSRNHKNIRHIDMKSFSHPTHSKFKLSQRNAFFRTDENYCFDSSDVNYCLRNWHKSQCKLNFKCKCGI